MTWVGLIIIRNKKVLMVQEDDIDFLVFPGGGMEGGESREDTLQREILEELGTKPINYRMLLETDLPAKAEGIMIHFVVYIGKVEGRLKLGEDIQGVKWVDTNYLNKDYTVGHLASMSVLPHLKSIGLIN